MHDMPLGGFTSARPGLMLLMLTSAILYLHLTLEEGHNLEMNVIRITFAQIISE